MRLPRRMTVIGAGLISAAAHVPALSHAKLDPRLPALPPIVVSEPTPDVLNDLDRTLELITSEDARTRENARNTLDKVEASSVRAIHQRIQDIRGTLDRDRAPRLLEEIRKAARKDIPPRGPLPKGRGGVAKEDGGDWLEFALRQARPRDPTWKHLVNLLAMTRMLGAIGSTEAAREIVQLHAYFGDLLRIDLQRQIARLKDKAVPALIEAREHDAQIVQKWARRQLDLLGKAIPGEAVATDDSEVLADVLLAYGRIRDVDALRVILSFCDSEHAHVRRAAREAITGIGEAGRFQLRDAFQNATGEKPPRHWSWDQIAAELFNKFDEARLKEVNSIFEDALEKAKASKTQEAVSLFDLALSRAPLFERRAEAIQTYVAYAKSLQEAEPERAVYYLQKAMRVAPTDKDANAISAQRYALEGHILLKQKRPERFLFSRALELDPGNDLAKRGLSELEALEHPEAGMPQRQKVAFALGIASLVSAFLLLFRRRPPTQKNDNLPTEEAA